VKQAYERVFTDWGDEYVKVQLLPECKRISKRGNVYEFQKVRRRLLGLIPYTKWVNKLDIKMYPAETVEHYTCDCGDHF
jgi:hypothetical protein